MVKNVNIKEANEQADIYVGRLRAVSLFFFGSNARERASSCEAQRRKRGLVKPLIFLFLRAFLPWQLVTVWKQKKIIEHLANYV